MPAADSPAGSSQPASQASPTARAMVATEPGKRLEPREIPIERPRPGWARVQVIASGVCRADLEYAANPEASQDKPVTPGHEIAGIIAELGDDVRGWSLGDRVAVGWFGGSCGHCAFCRVGDVVHCSELQVPGSSYPGGWSESVTVPASALARIPDGMDFFDAAPMGCAGVTTFNAIRKANLAPGSAVAVLGIGGLGHLAIQFAAKMGFHTIAIARGAERAGLARSLGAHDFIDATAGPAGKALAALGGADLVVCTAQTSEPVSGLLAGLRPHGRITLLGVDSGSITLPAAMLVMHELSVGGVVTGNTRDIEETMGFALTTGVRPLVERMPLEAANEALARIEAGNVAFRIVLDAVGQR